MVALGWLIGLFGMGFGLVLLPYSAGSGALIIGMSVLIALSLSLPLFAPLRDRSFMLQLLFVGLFAKMAATLVRLYMNEHVYGGGDSNRFHRDGARVADLLREFELGLAVSRIEPGTYFMEFFAGVVQVFTGSTLTGGFLVYGFFAFLGAVFFYRAFLSAFPRGDHRLYAVLIFLYPSVLYWPTGIGKDASVFFFAGMASWGAAKFMMESRVWGLVPLVLGLAMSFMIRPEVAAVLGVAFVAAFVVRGPARRPKALLIQAVAVPVLVVGGLVAAGAVMGQLGIGSLSVEGVLDVLAGQAGREFDEGRTGSNFVPPQVMTPAWVPAAFTTVLFRPFPWEAHNVPALVQSLDGVFLGALLALSLPRMWRAAWRSLRSPYLVYAFLSLLFLVLALATLGNYGLLARQRAIVLPFLFFAVAAAPAVRRERAPAHDGDSADSVRPELVPYPAGGGGNGAGHVSNGAARRGGRGPVSPAA